MMLTRLPAGRISGDVPTLAQSAWAFPIVGLMVGGVGAVPLLLAQGFGLSVTMAAGLSLLAMMSTLYFRAHCTSTAFTLSCSGMP